MGFKLKKSESVGAGIRRVAREEIDAALELVEDRKADPEETVHELRKHFKKVRAVLRLVRDDLGEETYRRDNAAVRGLGRRLASARDAAVRVSALDRLRSEEEKDFPADRASALQRRLAARYRAALSRLRRGSTLGTMRRELEDLRQRVRAWPIHQEGFACLEPGLRRVYRQGRSGEKDAYATRADEAFHEWRKRAKDLRYHVDLLEPVWPETMKDMGKALHDLTDCLGDDHDFADLRRTLAESPALVAGQEGVAAIIERIDGRRSKLQTAARPLGVRIYSEKPDAFSRRMESYWTAWRSCPDE
jgi:CHAD domain-containing protein